MKKEKVEKMEKEKTKVKRPYNIYTKDIIFASAMGVSLEEYLLIKVENSVLIYGHEFAEYGEKAFERLYFSESDSELFLYEAHLIRDHSTGESLVKEKIYSAPITIKEASSWFEEIETEHFYKKRRPMIDSITKEEVNNWIVKQNEWIDEVNKKDYNLKKIEKL